MGLFDQLKQSVGSMGKTLSNAGSSMAVDAQDNAELGALKRQVKVIDQDIEAGYLQIGRRYTEYVIQSGDMPGIDVTDILKMIEPKMEQRAAYEKQIIEMEKKIKNNAVIREKQEAEEAYLKEKEKLDRALAMDVMSQSEYESKLTMARARVDHFEDIRRIEQQYEMKVISKEERDYKIQSLLNG